MKNVRHITPTQVTMNIAGPLAERMQQCTLPQFKGSVIHAIGKTDLAPRLAELAVATEVNTLSKTPTSHRDPAADKPAVYSPLPAWASPSSKPSSIAAWSTPNPCRQRALEK